ncbi:unnamed protein product [Peniophora sp. CBMAI 1063]|nr:unnamed protein product [Peniophora sp. CBMAI 1063]
MKAAVPPSRPSSVSRCHYVWHNELKLDTPSPLTLEADFLPRSCLVMVGVFPGVCSFAQAILNSLGVPDATVYRCESAMDAMSAYFAKKNEVRVEGDERFLALYKLSVGPAIKQLLARVWPPSDRMEAARLLTDPISGRCVDLLFDEGLAKQVEANLEELWRDQHDAAEKLSGETVNPSNAKQLDVAGDDSLSIPPDSPPALRTPVGSGWRYSMSWESQRVIKSPIHFLQKPHTPDNSGRSSPTSASSTPPAIVPETYRKGSVSTPNMRSDAGRARTELLGLLKGMGIGLADTVNLDRFIVEVNGLHRRPDLPVPFVPTAKWQPPNKLTPAHDSAPDWYPSSANVNKAIERAGLTVFAVKWTIVVIGNAPGIFPSLDSAKARNQYTPSAWFRYEFADSVTQAIDRWHLRIRHKLVEIVKLRRVAPPSREC